MQQSFKILRSVITLTFKLSRFSTPKIGVQVLVVAISAGVRILIALASRYSSIVGRSASAPRTWGDCTAGAFVNGAFTPVEIALVRVWEAPIFCQACKQFLGPRNCGVKERFWFCVIAWVRRARFGEGNVGIRGGPTVTFPKFNSGWC